MSSVRLLGALTTIARTNVKCLHTGTARYAATGGATNRKHTDLKVVDNVGVICFDTPGAKVKIH
ncbi:hypothetical protein ABEB36_011688 [Hypothenemus hampei]|uniref:Uncharacterized protein n=1 Tax=Hypothenemus hampei TaxID=57062 RepID=A0ABD1E8Y0_HYPHA